MVYFRNKGSFEKKLHTAPYLFQKLYTTLYIDL
jgi:hypothetical protein